MDLYMFACNEIYPMQYVYSDNGFPVASKGTQFLIGILFLCFWLQWFFNENYISKLFLSDFSPLQLISHQFLHADSIHLIINLALLYIFGIIVETRLGAIALYFFFILFGVAGGVSFLLCGGRQAVGASGAISGLIGLSLVLDIKTKIYFGYRKFYAPVYLMAGLWVLKDLIFLLFPLQRAASAGHLGGFLSGVACGFLVVYLKKRWNNYV